MTLKKDTYKKLACLSMPVLLLLPALIINLHILLHHHPVTENHHHDTTTLCNDEISLCTTCSDFIFTFFTSVAVKTSTDLVIFMFKSIDCKSIEDIYFNLFSGHKKGRSPPKIL